MRDASKTKAQLVDEVQALRRRVVALQADRVIRPQGGRTQGERQEFQEVALQRVRDAIWRMKRVDEIERLLNAVEDGLRLVGVPFRDCGINVVDVAGERPRVRFYNMEQRRWLEAGKGRGRDIVLRIWQEGRVAYRPDLEAEDPYGESAQLQRIFARPVRSVLDVPFAQGTLAVNSEEAHAFSDADIGFMSTMARTLAEGFQRLEDLQNLERRNWELERQIAEREQAEEKLRQQASRLVQTNQELIEKERLLSAFQDIGQIALSSLDLDEILDTLAAKIVRAGIFRSLMIALVDERGRSVEVVRDFRRMWPGDEIQSQREGIVGLRYDLEDDNITAEVARTGQMQIIEGWDARFDASVDKEGGRKGQVAYFVPVTMEGRVLAVLATGSSQQQKREMLHRIEVMQPLLTQMAIALDHARLYAEVRRHARQQVHLERMRALGEMAAGVSHNLNNILVGVLGPAQLLQRQHANGELGEKIGEIITSGRRATDLVRRLNQALRDREEEELQPVAVNKVIEEVVVATRPRWKDEAEARGLVVEMETRLQQVPPVRGTVLGLHDMLVNLLFNAVEALPQGGRISVCSRALEGVVEVQVADTGIGMDEEVRRRIFEPFFTTKMEVGTGLGLATVYGTVRRWDGDIAVESAPGEGTTFSIRLPIWGAPQPGATEEVPRSWASTSGRVLVVDDDEKVLEVLEELLAPAHQVRLFRSGDEVLKAFSAGACDAALIDLGVPGGPGDAIARQIRRQDPTVSTVLITGWDLSQVDLSSFDFRLQKPFVDLEHVRDVVARAVELHAACVRNGR